MTQIHYNTSQNEHRVTIHKKYRLIHFEVTITSTLPLNQEGILSTQFISTSLLLCIIWVIVKSLSYSSHLRLQVIFHFSSHISFGSESSLDLDHRHWIILDLEHCHQIILNLEHHWIWIITRSGSSSLDWIWIITRYGSSLLDLDHHSIQIIIARSRSSLDLDLLESS